MPPLRRVPPAQPPEPDLFVNPDEVLAILDAEFSYPGGGAGPTLNDFGACEATWRVVGGVGE